MEKSANRRCAGMVLAMLLDMTSRNSQRRDDQSDTLVLVWATSVMAAFLALLIDLRLCAIIAAVGVLWTFYVMRRLRIAAEHPLS